MLEQQQKQLVAGLEKLYRLLQDGQPWPEAPLETQNGRVLAHDILRGLGLLAVLDSSRVYNGFEADCDRM